MTTEERITRLEKTLWDLGLVVSDGNPRNIIENVRVNGAAKRFNDTMVTIGKELGLKP